LSDDEPIDSQHEAPQDNSEAKEETLRAELGAIYDKNHAAQEKAEALQIVPSIMPGDSTQTAFEKTWDHLHATPQQQAAQRDASQLVEQVRTNAAKFGVELSDADAMKAAMELERDQARAAPSELAPAMEAIRRNYPDQAPHEVVGRYAEIDNYVKRAPAEAAGWIYQQQTGQSSLELARQIAVQHSPQQHQEFYVTRDVNTFFELVPDAAKFQPQIVAALERGEIQRTGNIIADMKRVYQHVRSKSQGNRKGGRRSMESEMEETWRRVNSR
jgi:site-specific recombinase